MWVRPTRTFAQSYQCHILTLTHTYTSIHIYYIYLHVHANLSEFNLIYTTFIHTYILVCVLAFCAPFFRKLKFMSHTCACLHSSCQSANASRISNANSCAGSYSLVAATPATHTKISTVICK